LCNAADTEFSCLGLPFVSNCLSLMLPLHCGVQFLQEGEQADTSQQGGKAPKNPITGEPLTPVQNKDKEGYQATVLAGQSEETSARIMKQLDGQDGRPFGGGCCACVGVAQPLYCALEPQCGLVGRTRGTSYGICTRPQRHQPPFRHCTVRSTALAAMLGAHTLSLLHFCNSPCTLKCNRQRSCLHSTVKSCLNTVTLRYH
jgi:hypothetical protein